MNVSVCRLTWPLPNRWHSKSEQSSHSTSRRQTRCLCIYNPPGRWDFPFRHACWLTVCPPLIQIGELVVRTPGITVIPTQTARTIKTKYNIGWPVSQKLFYGTLERLCNQRSGRGGGGGGGVQMAESGIPYYPIYVRR